MSQALYLNNTGSRWIIPGQMKFYSLELDKSGKPAFVLRTADCYEACGNFASTLFRKSGVRCFGFYDDQYRYKGLPVMNNTEILYHEATEIYDRLGATIGSAEEKE